jgi:hypothetical protein
MEYFAKVKVSNDLIKQNEMNGIYDIKEEDER